MPEALFPTRWQYDKPPSIAEFMHEFPDNYACAEYLAKKRWPDGFVCRCCGSQKGWRLETRPWIWECAGKGTDRNCRKQTSLIAGTVMQGTHLPLSKWFMAAYLMATHSNSISALQLQPKIGVTYKTAWLLLHKLRRAMVNPEREPLRGNVEADETFMPWHSKEEDTSGEMIVIGALERIGKFQSGRIRLKRIDGRSRADFHPFIEENTAPNCRLYTDMAGGYVGVPRVHFPSNLSAQTSDAPLEFMRIHRVFTNFKRWSLGTFHGLGPKHLDAYLNEYVFRWNRRRSFQSAMDRMLGIGVSLEAVTYDDIVGDTGDWVKKRKPMLKKMHKKRVAAFMAVLQMANPGLYMVALFAKATGQNPFTAVRQARLAAARAQREEDKKAGRKRPRRKPPKRPALAPRRPGEERIRSGYAHPPRIPAGELELGYLRHIPPEARVWA